MGTRGLVQVFDRGEWEGEKFDNQLIRVYRQFDCYPKGMGRDLVNFLDGRVVTNGIMVGETRPIFNGAGDLAAQLVHYLKGDGNGNPQTGSVYINSMGGDWKDGGTCWQEWVYNIIVERGEITLQVWDVYGEREFFRGSVEEFKQKLDSLD